MTTVIVTATVTRLGAPLVPVVTGLEEVVTPRTRGLPNKVGLA